jgi:uncharacterized membrane protein
MKAGHNSPVSESTITERLGGPFGRLANRGYTLLPPIYVLIILAAMTYALGYLLDFSCGANGWSDPQRYMHLCYSDIPPLYVDRGFAEGIFPYVQTGTNGVYLEYPVGTGVFMYISAVITGWILPLYPDGYRAFFDVNVILLFIPFVVTVIATALTKPRDPWRAAMIVFAPTMILAATINWDLIPIALVSLAFLAWSKENATLTGVLLGLAIASKFYPVFLLFGFILLAWKNKSWRPTLNMIVATFTTFLAVNIPFAIANFEGWIHFYTFNFGRSIDFGSFWYALTQIGLPTIPDDLLNFASTALFLLLLIGIAILVKRAPHSPNIAQISFLILAAFVVTNKVYSPQYVLWLVPLAVLARPNWRDFLIWQFGEVIYFIAIWWFLAGYGVDESQTLTPQWYAAATFVHIAATLYFAIRVVIDIQQGQTTDTDQITNTESKRDVVNRTSALT